MNTADSINTFGTRYYGTAAVRTTAGSTAGLHWLVPNHQASNTTSVAAGDGTVSRRRFGPYGESRTGSAATLATTRGFLNKTEDPVGLVATDARYLDTVVAQFLSVDPISV